jgi:hypothetical protein
LYKLNLVDAIIPEPLGGAHRNVHDTVHNVEEYIVKTLRDLKRIKIDSLLDSRYKKLRSIGSNINNPAKDNPGKTRIKSTSKPSRAKLKPIPAEV